MSSNPDDLNERAVEQLVRSEQLIADFSLPIADLIRAALFNSEVHRIPFVMTNSDTAPLEGASSDQLGKLLLRQTGATRLRSTVWLSAALLFFGLGFVFLFTELWELGIALIAAGLLYVVVVLYGRFKSIECYENGLIVRKPFKSHTVPHKDVAAIQFLAVRKYSQGLYHGTISHFTIMPMLDKTITIRIHGSRKDSERVWTIVQTVLERNPDARLEELQ